MGKSVSQTTSSDQTPVDEFGIPIRTNKSTDHVDDFGIPIKKKDVGSQKSPASPSASSNTPTNQPQSSQSGLGFQGIQLFDKPQNTQITTKDGGVIPINKEKVPSFILDPDKYVSDLQKRVSDGTHNEVDISNIAVISGKSEDAIRGYTQNKAIGMAVENVEDLQKTKSELINSITQYNKNMGTDYDPEKILSSPENSADFLNQVQKAAPILRQKNDDRRRRIQSDPEGISYEIRDGQPVAVKNKDLPLIPADEFNPESFLNKSRQYEAALTRHVINTTIEDDQKNAIPKDQTVVKIAKRIDPKGFDQAQKALQTKTGFDAISDTEINPLKAIGALWDEAIGTTRKDDLLNSVKGIAEVRYNQGLTDVAINKVSQGILSNDPKLVQEGQQQLKEVDNEVIYKYPALLKSQIASDVSRRIAEESGQIEGSSIEGEGIDYIRSLDEKLRGATTREHYRVMKELGYLDNPKTRDAAMQVLAQPDLIADASYFGGFKSSVVQPFKDLGLSLGDLTGIRNEKDIFSDKKIDELFPKERDDLKTHVSMIRNVTNTTGNLIGMAVIAAGTEGLGEGLGLSANAAQRLGAYTSFGIPSWDRSYKDAYNFLDSNTSRGLYATMSSIFNSEGGKLLDLGKVVRIPGVSEEMAKIAKGISEKTMTRDAARELLNEAQPRYLDFALKYGKNVTKGAATMAYFNASENALKAAFGDPNTNLDDILPNAGHAFFGGILGMSIMGAWGAAADMSKEANTTYKGTIYNMAQNHDATSDVFKMAYEKGSISKEEYDVKMKILNTARENKGILDASQKESEVSLTEDQKAVYVANKTVENVIREKAKNAQSEAEKTRLTEQADRLNQQSKEVFDGLKFNEVLEPLYSLYKAEKEYNQALNDVKFGDITPEEFGAKKDAFEKMQYNYFNGGMEVSARGDEVNRLLNKGIESGVIDNEYAPFVDHPEPLMSFISERVKEGDEKEIRKEFGDALVDHSLSSYPIDPIEKAENNKKSDLKEIDDRLAELEPGSPDYIKLQKEREDITDYYDNYIKNLGGKVEEEKAGTEPIVPEHVPEPEGRIEEPGREEPAAKLEVESDAEVPPPTESEPSAETQSRPEPTTSIKNETTKEERNLRGLEEVEVTARRGFQQVWDTAKEMVDTGKRDPRQMADQIVKKPRALNPEESSMLLYDRMRLYNEHEDAINELIEARDNGDEARETEAVARMAYIEYAIETNDEASRLSGYEQGLGLAVRRMITNKDYSLANQKRRISEAYDGEVPKEVSDRLEKYDRELKEANKKLEEYEERWKQAQAQGKIEELKKEEERERKKQRRASNKEDIRKERDDLFAQLKKAKEDEQKRTGQTMGFSLPNEAFPILAKLARNYIKEGINTLDGIVDGIYENIKDAFPDVSKRDIRDAISGYGMPKKENKNEVEKKLNDIKSQARLVSSLEDVEDGKKPKKGTTNKSKPSEQVSDLRRQLNKAMREAGIKPDRTPRTPEEKKEIFLKSAKTRLENQISQLEEQLRTGVKPEKGYSPEYDEEVKALQAERDRLKSLLREADDRDMSTDQRILSIKRGLERQIKQYEDKIRDNKSPNDKKAKPVTPEIEALTNRLNSLKKEYDKLQNDSYEDVIKRNALEDYKDQLNKKAIELQDKLDRGEFDEVEKPQKVFELDNEAIDLKKKVKDIQDKFDIERKKAYEKNRSGLKKFIDGINKWRRAALLSGISTLGKLQTAAMVRYGISTPLEELEGAVLSKIPGISSIAEKAPREGGASIKAEVEAISQIWQKATYQDVRDIIKTGKGSLDVLYGKNNNLPPEALDFFGQLHSALKATPKRAEFFRSFEKRLEFAAKNGLDVTDPVLQSNIAAEAYIDANRAIFMQDNWLTDKYRGLVNSLEKGGAGAQISAGALKFLLPIVKVPTNFAGEVTSYALGTVKAAVALRKGIDNLSPKEADYVMRNMKKGLIGLGVLALGYFNPEMAGGYYQPFEKRKKGELKAGQLELFGVQLPTWMGHAPLLEMIQLGATMRKVHDKYKKKKRDESGAILAGLHAGAAGVLSEVPFFEEPGSISKATEDPKQMGFLLRNEAKGFVVPRIIQELAEQTDRPKKPTIGEIIKGEGENKRKTETVLEAIESGIPGLRQKLKKKGTN